MITVKRLMSVLQRYPPDALVYAYEGESVGIVIVSPAKHGIREEFGFIPASESNELDKEQAKKESARRKKKRA